MREATSKVRQNAETAIIEAISREILKGKTYEQIADDFTRILQAPEVARVRAGEVKNVHAGLIAFGVKAARKIVKALQA